MVFPDVPMLDPGQRDFRGVKRKVAMAFVAMTWNTLPFITSNIFTGIPDRIPMMTVSENLPIMQSFGARKNTTESSMFPKSRIMQTSSRFSPALVGHTSTTDFALIGAFNPIEIQSAQMVLSANTGIVNEWSSYFISSATATTSRFLQWDTPTALNTMASAGAQADGAYDKFTPIKAEVALEFENHSTNNNIHIWYKLFWPGDRDHINFTGEANLSGEAASALSIRGLKWSATRVFSGVSRSTYERLMSTPDMYHFILGPDSANGPPNLARIMLEIDSTKLIRSMGPEGYLDFNSTLETFGSAVVNPAFGNQVQKITQAKSGSSSPMVLFFGGVEAFSTASETVGLPMESIDTANKQLVVRGICDYTMSVFQREVHANEALDDDDS